MPRKTLEYRPACFHPLVYEQRPEEWELCTVLGPGAGRVGRFELRQLSPHERQNIMGQGMWLAEGRVCLCRFSISYLSHWVRSPEVPLYRERD